MTKWNNDYKYKFTYSCRSKSSYIKSNNNYNDIRDSIRIIYFLTSLINIYLKDSNLVLLYDNNCCDFICKFYDEYEDEYGNLKINVITNPQTILFWLTEYEIDTSGFEIKQLDGEDFLYLKPKYINEILHKVTNTDIENAFKYFELVSKLMNYILMTYKKVLSTFQIYSNSNNIYIVYNSADDIRMIKNKFKYINIDFYSKGYDERLNSQDIYIFKITDINTTNAMLRITGN